MKYKCKLQGPKQCLLLMVAPITINTPPPHTHTRVSCSPTQVLMKRKPIKSSINFKTKTNLDKNNDSTYNNITRLSLSNFR